MKVIKVTDPVATKRRKDLKEILKNAEKEQ